MNAVVLFSKKTCFMRVAKLVLHDQASHSIFNMGIANKRINVWPKHEFEI